MGDTHTYELIRSVMDSKAIYIYLIIVAPPLPLLYATLSLFSTTGISQFSFFFTLFGKPGTK
jgi:hypothetical protein